MILISYSFHPSIHSHSSGFLYTAYHIFSGPFNCISRTFCKLTYHPAAEYSHSAGAGDEVLVAPGVYREYVDPVNAGTWDARITYTSTTPLGAVITGAEPVKTWAPPAAFQDGMIGPHWSKGWIIEDCEISNSKCVGISLGKYCDRRYIPPQPYPPQHDGYLV